MTSIKLSNVGKTFRGHDGEHPVLKNLSLEVAADRFTCVLGANGSGKSTLLNLVAKLDQPDAGTIELPPPRSRIAARVGYVWQDYRASLLPWYSILDNITFPLRLAGVDAKVRRETGMALMRRFMPGIEVDGRCYKLSGGQQQLLCLLRAACAEPDILLLDEPFSALDQQRSWRMAGFVERVWIEQRVPTLFVSHDVDEGILLADDIILLSRAALGVGRIVRNDLPRPRTMEMLNSPEHIRCRKEVLEFLFDAEPESRGALRVNPA